MKFALLAFFALIGSAYAADNSISCTVMGAINQTAVKPDAVVTLDTTNSTTGAVPNAEKYTYSIGRDVPNSVGNSLIEIVVKKADQTVATVFGYDHAYLIYQAKVGLFAQKNLEIEINCGQLQE